MNLPVLRFLLVLLVLGDALLIPGFQTSRPLSLFLVAMNLLFHASALLIILKFPGKFAACKIPFIVSGLISLGLFLRWQGTSGFISLASFTLSLLLLHPQMLTSFRPRLLLALLLPLFLPIALAQLIEPPLSQIASPSRSDSPISAAKTTDVHGSDPAPESNKKRGQSPKNSVQAKANSEAEAQSLSINSPEPNPVPELIASLKFLPQSFRRPPPPYYLRETAYVAFDGHSWFSPNLPKSLIKSDEKSWISLGPNRDDSALRYEITLAKHDSPRILALPGLVKLRVPQIQVDSSQTCFLPAKPEPAMVYQAQSIPVVYAQCPPTLIVPGQTDPSYLQVPRGPVYDEIRRTAEILSAETKTPAETIAAIHFFLQKNFSYELNLQQQSLEEFFLRRKKGHCTLFATSFTLMLRSIKIPARVAVGYTSNLYDESTNSYLFIADQRHAWCEIFLENYGWISFDPTPPAAIANSAEFPQSIDSIAPDEASDPASPPPPQTQTQTSSAWAILLILLAIAYFIRVQPLIQQRRQRIQSEHRNRPSYAPLTEFYRIFCQTFSQLGAPRLDGETGRDYLQRLKQLGLAEQQFDDLIHYYYQIRYEEAPPELRREQEFLALLKLFRHQKKL